MVKKKTKGPKFVRYFPLVLDALRSLGSSAKPKEVCDWILDNHEVPKDSIEETTKDGKSKFEKYVAWARYYLARAGLTKIEKRGVWLLTEKGRETKLSHKQALALFKEVDAGIPRNDKAQKPSDAQSVAEDVEDEDASAPDEGDYFNQNEIQKQLVELLRSVSDKGFEELCARLLRHIGFENVKVTGKAGDHGIDGEGFLLINRFVRTKVMFQCKRYKNAVPVNDIRDFRGALNGRAERGIFLTTGTFTRAAREEADRENTTAIELVDIDRLLELMIAEGLGVQETKALKIEPNFFAVYQREN